jgi:hypothetical protein
VLYQKLESIFFDCGSLLFDVAEKVFLLLCLIEAIKAHQGWKAILS